MRRGKRVFPAIAGLMVCLTVWWVLARPGGKGEDKVWARIQREGVMHVGLDASWPPFEYMEGGEIVGFDVDLAQEIGERLGLEVAFVNIGFNTLYDTLQSGKIDLIISALPYDPTKTEDVAYSTSYFDAGQVLVVRTDEREIKGVKDLAGKGLAVEWGSEGDVQGRRLQKRIKGLTLQPYMAPKDVLRALERGEVDAALVDAISALKFIGNGGSIQIIGQPLTDERYVIAVRPESYKLLKAVNGALVDMKEDGTLARLRERWF